MDLNKINDFVVNLPKKIDHLGRECGNEIHVECDISGTVAIYKLFLDNLSFEIQKEGSCFLILSRNEQSVIGFNQFANGENLEDELISVISFFSSHRNL